MSAANVLRLRDCEKALKEIRALAENAQIRWDDRREVLVPSLDAIAVRAILAKVPE